MKPPRSAISVFGICNLVSLFAFAFAVAARANVIDYSAATGILSTGSSVNITLPEFDSNLGTLQAVNLTLTSTINGSVSIFNLTGASQSFTNALASLTIGVTGPDGTAASVTPVVTVPFGTVNPGETDFGPLSNVASSSVTASTLSSYEAVGGGSLSFAVVSSSGGYYQGTSVPGVFFGGAVSSSGDVDVAYTFTPVRVPDSLCTGGTLAVALGLLGLIRRRLVYSTPGALN
jgi:hypothetical protein